jgi:hypothetical protein
VAHPGHQILQARVAGCREVVPRVPEIVKVQALGVDRSDGMRPTDILLKWLRRIGARLTREHERFGLQADEQG